MGYTHVLLSVGEEASPAEPEPEPEPGAGTAPVEWSVHVAPAIWTADAQQLSEDQSRELRAVIASWGRNGPPEGATMIIGGRLVQQFETAKGIVIKFVSRRNGDRGQDVFITRVVPSPAHR